MKTFVATLICLLVFASDCFAFGPCSKVMPPEISYYPKVSACRGKAAIMVNGSLLNAFSAVVRACDNGDRDPCYKSLNACATNQSSPFKAHFIVPVMIEKGGKTVGAKLHCLGEAGNSAVYRMVRRLTIKRVNPVRNPATDVFKICLSNRTVAKNPYTFVEVGTPISVGNTGFNKNCLTQKYLGCNVNAVTDRICHG